MFSPIHKVREWGPPDVRMAWMAKLRFAGDEIRDGATLGYFGPKNGKQTAFLRFVRSVVPTIASEVEMLRHDELRPFAEDVVTLMQRDNVMFKASANGTANFVTVLVYPLPPSQLH